MGFDEGRLELDSPNGTYYSGQTVSGKLIFYQDKVKSFRGIFVKLKGFCHVHWTTTRTRTVNGKSQSYTVHHNSHEEYVNTKMYLVGGESGDHSIEPGSYEYPFHFRLPPICPPSFEGAYGHVRYHVKAVVDRAFKFDQEKKVAVRVMAPLDLNLDPYCREPIEFELQDTYCCCCFSSGSSEVLVKLPIAGYCPGQTIPIEVSCSNKGNVQIDDIKLIINKRVTFIATSEPGIRKDKDKVAEIKKGPIPGNTNRNWTVEMEVPAMDVYNLSACQYINLEYKFKVVVSAEGCRSDSKESRRIVIGTIPLVGYQDNVQNPLHDQMPQPMPVTQQPMMTSYPPVVNTYPDGVPEPINQPFPGPQPYPGNSPYPLANPYPNSNHPSPYPPSSSPYVPTSSPYPSANPPYPNVTPYMDNPPPYPGNMSNPDPNPPYPAEKQPLLTEKLVTNSPYNNENPPTSSANPPYPVVNPPTSGANPPYPGANPPYPVTSSPYPPENAAFETKSNPGPVSIGGLKTGKLGFTVSSGGTGMMPPLPPGNAGSPRPASPYATASAPAPDSPDSALPEKKE